MAEDHREEDQEQEPEILPEEEQELDSEKPGDEDEAEHLPVIRSYAILLQSLTAEAVPQIKRRKVMPTEEPMKTDKEDAHLDKVDGDERVDVSEEDREGLQTVPSDDSSSDDDEVGDLTDPFVTHFADPDDNILAKRLKCIQSNHWSCRKAVLESLAKAVINIPGDDDDKVAAVMPIVSKPEELKLKQKVAAVISKQRPSFDDLEKSMAPLMFKYQDILYCERSAAVGEILRRLTCLHAINHVFK